MACGSCDICKAPAVNVVDGKNRYGHYWCDMCAACFAVVGVGLGIGRGCWINSTTREKLPSKIDRAITKVKSDGQGK